MGVDWIEVLETYWPYVVAALSFLTALIASGHALLHKREPRAAVLWIAFIWFLPAVGSLLYIALGINRIRRQGQSLRAVRSPSDSLLSPIPEDMGEPHQIEAKHLRMLARVVDRVASRPLAAGNAIEPLVNGDEAFPAMLAAIENAKTSVALASYIFDNDHSGTQFVEALGRAVQRGLTVRVLIDAAGARYSLPSIFGKLKQARVPTKRFLPTLAPWRLPTMNLHNHRKLLVTDGRIGFTGGINIREGNVLKSNPGHPVQDLHFKLQGPVVAQLQDAFASDWEFCTGEILSGAAWFPELKPDGSITARVVTDGPDADFEKARWTLLAALASAQSSVQILTPYFLPEPTLVSALNLAALRGVRVDIILPEKNNLPFMHWASRALWWQVLEKGCRIWLTQPPFDHSKLMLVDSHWAFIGSANWDPRSLRLNFELNVECYGREFAERMKKIVAGKLKSAREVTQAEVDRRPLPVRLSDNLVRLFTPYL